MTFAKGDRVKVEFEGTVLGEDDPGIYWVTDADDSEYFIDEKFLTKIEKVHPAGAVWVWYDNIGQVDAIKAAGAYTKTDFASYVACLDSPDQIIAIHEPEEKS